MRCCKSLLREALDVHFWRCSKTGWTGRWSAWSSVWQLCPWQGQMESVGFEIPSNWRCSKIVAQGGTIHYALQWKSKGHHIRPAGGTAFQVLRFGFPCNWPQTCRTFQINVIDVKSTQHFKGRLLFKIFFHSVAAKWENHFGLYISLQQELSKMVKLTKDG